MRPIHEPHGLLQPRRLVRHAREVVGLARVGLKVVEANAPRLHRGADRLPAAEAHRLRGPSLVELPVEGGLGWGPRAPERGQQVARIQPRRDGKTIYYSLTDDRPRKILEVVYELFCKDSDAC